MSPPRGRSPARKFVEPDVEKHHQIEVSLASRKFVVVDPEEEEPPAKGIGDVDPTSPSSSRKEKLSGGASMKHQDPLKGWHAMAIFAAIAIPNACLVAGFSTMGYGMYFFNTVAEPDFSWQGDMFLCLATTCAAILLIMDWWYMPFVLKVMFGAVPLIIFFIGTLCKGRKYPWAIMIVILSMIPLLLGLVRFSFCKTVQLKQFYAAVSGSALVIGLGIAAMWGWYVWMDDHKWDTETQYELIAEAADLYKHAYKERALNYDMDCGPDKNLDNVDKNEKAKIKKACSQAGTVWFLCYMCPGISIGTDLVLFIFCLVNGVIGRIDDFSAVQRQLTRFILGVAFLLSGMLATATVSATSIRLGSTLMAFFAAGLALLTIWIYSEVDHSALIEASHHSHLMQSLVKVWNSEWTKAIFCCMFFGPAIIFFTLNAITQSVRKARGIADDPHQRYTPSGRWLISHVHDFPWTRILVKVCVLAELFFTLQVGVAKVTYVFLSWLNTTLASTGFMLVLVLVFLIGSTMFLLPPVPGLPVYLFAGILIGEKGRQDPSIGFWLGCVIATALSLFTKLCACLGQYAIGFFLGKSVKVQQLIGVDKVPTRAIEQVLKSRGLNPGKVSVLVGGPDWPTSVTCGIVRVNVPQMLLGTIPVVSLLAPCILAGACMGRVKPGEDSVWNMAASASTALAAVVNMASMAYAVYTIGEVIEHNGEELARPRPEHEAVAELTRKEQAAVDMYNDTVQWGKLSTFWQTWLFMTTAAMLMANGFFVLLAEVCFRPFAVSSKIADPYELDGLEGSVSNIVLHPVGSGSLCLFLFGAVLHIIFSKFMARKSAARLKAEGPLGGG